MAWGAAITQSGLENTAHRRYFFSAGGAAPARRLPPKPAAGSSARSRLDDQAEASTCRKRSLAAGMLIESAEHGKRHGLDAGFDGRLRHRREQRRMIGRQFGSGSIACRDEPLQLVDADIEHHRRD